MTKKASDTHWPSLFWRSSLRTFFTLPTSPVSNITFIPCVCSVDLVSNRFTNPCVSSPLRWWCFCTISTAAPMVMFFLNFPDSIVVPKFVYLFRDKRCHRPLLKDYQRSDRHYFLFLVSNSVVYTLAICIYYLLHFCFCIFGHIFSKSVFLKHFYRINSIFTGTT